MPSKKNPNSIKSGSGSNSAENKTSFSLNPVNTGSVNKGSSTHAEAQNDHPLGGHQSPLANHLNTNSNSHKASEISIDNKPKEVFDSHNVEGALDELSALIPPKPPKIGFERDYMLVSGYPDWGVLKLNDSSILYRDSASFLNDNMPSQVYPYYWQPPFPADDYKPFTPDTDYSYTGDYTPRGIWSEGGDDPHTDKTFNVLDSTYSGGGVGNVYSGAFTRDPDHDPLTPNVGKTTLRVYPIKNDTHFGVVLSGMVYPADRGVLALLHYEEGGTLSDFMAQSLDKKVVCAILLGTGVLNDGCPCDGDVGGIFEVGKDSSGDYDPYSFPGQAAGQGDLYEIHTGFKSGSTTLHDSSSAYYNFDGLSSESFDIVSSSLSINPTYETSTNHSFAIGQIVTIKDHTVLPANGERKITATTSNTFTVEMPDGGNAPAGGGTGGTVVQLIGCNPNHYTVLPYPGQVRLGTDPNSGVTPLPNGIPILGATSFARGGGDDNNFFRYRLPYLDDYTQISSASLKWTPETEKFRYYQKPTVSLNPSTNLETAGDYSAFSKDYYPFQVARYRHRFMVDSCMCHPSPVNDGFDLGSYVLIHFKKEKYFEEFVRDGVVPTADKIYSASMNDYSQIESLSNITETAGNPAVPYHTIRSTVFAENLDGVAPPTVANVNYQISRTVDTVVRVSGIAYFIPQNNFTLTNIRTDVVGLFENTYKVNDHPSLINSMPNPVLYSVSAFSWGTQPGIDNPTFTTTLGYNRYQRVEMSLSDLGFDLLTNPPLSSDTASINYEITPTGDSIAPSFSSDARLRLFFRRPIGHSDVGTTILPPNGYSVGENDGVTVLYQSVTNTSIYGNFQVNPGVDTSTLPTVGQLAIQKWSSETFLDEVFRYDSEFAAITAVDPILGRKLSGPGLPLSGVIAPIEIPIVAGQATNVSATELWRDSSWVQQDTHLSSIGMTSGLQVAGLPHRNPPLQEGVIYPVPNRGILMYPKKDYTSGHRPSVANGDITDPQFNYTTLIGKKTYTRVFALSSSFVGRSVVTLKIDGLSTKDFQYSPPYSGSDQIAIFVKVPGLTTWLDIGRKDGDGPSKQDPLLDGAGCCIWDSDTYNSYDTQTGHRFCYVKINVGSTANFFKMTEFGQVVCPLMVKVVFYDIPESKRYDFAHKIDPTNELPSATVDENANTRDVRGLIGISVLEQK